MLACWRFARANGREVDDKDYWFDEPGGGRGSTACDDEEEFFDKKKEIEREIDKWEEVQRDVLRHLPTAGVHHPDESTAAPRAAHESTTVEYPRPAVGDVAVTKRRREEIPQITVSLRLRYYLLYIKAIFVTKLGEREYVIFQTTRFLLAWNKKRHALEAKLLNLHTQLSSLQSDNSDERQPLVRAGRVDILRSMSADSIVTVT